MAELARDKIKKLKEDFGPDAVEVTMDDVMDCLGKEEYPEFERAMAIANKIIDNPSQVAGSAALISAAQLAALRAKIGARAQYYKTASVLANGGEKTIYTRRKNLLLCMYEALQENINTLKLLGRVESKMEDWT